MDLVHEAIFIVFMHASSLYTAIKYRKDIPFNNKYVLY